MTTSAKTPERLERELGSIFKGPYLAESDFDTISRILGNLGKIEWSFRPRTYAVLRIIGQVDLFDQFILEGLDDTSFPLSADELPDSWGPSVRTEFLENQSLVLVRSTDVGFVGSGHKKFAQDADIYFDNLGILGPSQYLVMDSVMDSIADNVRSKLSRREYNRTKIQSPLFSNDDAIDEYQLYDLKKISHPHVMQLIGSYTDPKNTCILMSPVADCNLLEFLDRQPFPQKDLQVLRGFYGCLSSAILYLHENNYRHRNLSPSGIIIKKDRVFIGGFKILSHWKSTHRDPEPYSMLYIAPEALDHLPGGRFSDIWSLGCVFLDMATILNGKTLEDKSRFFDSCGTHLQSPARNFEAFTEWSERTSSTVSENQPLYWIRQMLRPIPQERLTADDVLNLIWYSKGPCCYYNSCCIKREGSADDTLELGSNSLNQIGPQLLEGKGQDEIHSQHEVRVPLLEKQAESSVQLRPNQVNHEEAREVRMDKWDIKANLAQKYRQQGRLTEAEELGVEVLELRGKNLGPRHQATMFSMSDLAKTYRFKRQFEKAERLGYSVLQLRKKELGGRHPKTIFSMAGLAMTYRSQGELEKAEELGLHVLVLRKEILGPRHPQTMFSMASLALTYRHQGQLEKAEKLGIEVLEMRKQELGPRHPDTLSSMADLVPIYQTKDEMKKAEELGVEVLELRKKELGPRHLDTIYSKAILATNYLILGKWEISKRLKLEVLEELEVLRGLRHIKTLRTAHILGKLYLFLGELEKSKEMCERVSLGQHNSLKHEYAQDLSTANELVKAFGERSRILETEMDKTSDSNSDNWKANFLVEEYTLEKLFAGLSSQEKHGRLDKATEVLDLAVTENQSDTDSDTTSDAESILSITASSTSSKTTFDHQAKSLATDEFVRFLLENEELREKFEAAVQCERIGPKVFEKGLRYFLKIYSVDLDKEATSRVHKEAVFLVRSRSSYVASCLTRAVTQEKESGVQIKALQKELKHKVQNTGVLEQFLENTTEMTRPGDIESIGNIQPQREAIDSDSEVSESDDNGVEPAEHGELSTLSQVRDFMRCSTAFSTLCENLQDFVHYPFKMKLCRIVSNLSETGCDNPWSESTKFRVNNVIKELGQIAPIRIWVSYQDFNSISNRLKGIIENSTKEIWDWWPLSPRVRGLLPGEARIHWYCSCDEERWEEVPVDFASRVNRLLQKQSSNTFSPTASLTTINPPLQGKSQNQAQMSSAALSFQDAERKTPSNGADNPQRIRSSVPNHNNTFTNIQKIQELYIFFCVVRGENLRLAQIPVHDCEDCEFFKQLKDKYLEFRGYLRRIFGIWKYSHCDFIRFEKIEELVMVESGRGVPDDNNENYQFHPRSSNVMQPLARDEFRRRFYGCHRQCSTLRRAILYCFDQKCKCNKPYYRSREAITRIPKKKWMIEEEGYEREVAWGIRAVESLSFFMVTIYHLLILIPPFIFWFLWLFLWDHHGDLQNAAVPFLLALGVIPLFWLPIVNKPIRR